MSASEQLAAVRRGLDAAAQQATAATPGPWAVDHNDPFSPDLVGVFSPSAKSYVYELEYDMTGFDEERTEEEQQAETDATFIAAWSPSHVTAVVGSLRTICDSIEATLGRHVSMVWSAPFVADIVTCAVCGGDAEDVPWPCPDVAAAVSSLAGLAAVWAPTEGEAEK